MNDLTEIALNALEREEANDANDEQDTTNDGADEKDTSNAGDGGDNDADESDDTDSEQNTDDNDGGDSDEDETDDDKKSDDDDSDESESDDKKETKKKSDEMTDEEFEELAKKRGYSKNKSDDSDDKKKAEDEAKRREAAINAIPKPKELDADTWGAMPPMNKIIYSKLPYITAHGKDGDVKVKTPEQLPDDFEFASDKARSQFNNDIQAQELTAQRMANAIQGQARQQQATSEQQARARAIINEVAELQKTGDLPTPKAAVNTPEFNTDPAVGVINKVLNYQAQRAAQGVRLSVRDALTLYRAEHPDEFKKPETKAKGDEERKNVAKKVAGNNKSTNKTAAEESGDSKRKYYRPGMSTQDVLDRALQDLD